MRTLGNIIWHFPFLGFVSALINFVFGGLFVLTVVGAPIGIGLIELGKFMLSPFKYQMVKRDDVYESNNQLWKTYGFIVWLVYLPFGLLFTVILFFRIVSCFLSIIGIPVAIVGAKSLGTYLNPVNKICVPKGVAQEIERRKATAYLDSYNYA